MDNFNDNYSNSEKYSSINSEAERRFKVKKIEKYEKMTKKEKIKIAFITLATVCSMLAIIIGLDVNFSLKAINDNSQHLLFENYMAYSIIGIGSGSFVIALQDLIEAIAKKVNLESKIEDLKEEIEFFDRETQNIHPMKRSRRTK